MQGERSTIGPLPDSIHFDYGSPTSNVGVDQQICWNNLRNFAESSLSDFRISGGSSSDTFMGGVSQEGRWSIGGSSSSNPHNVVSYDDRMTESGWPSSNNSSTNFVSHTGVNLNLGSNPVATGPSFLRISMDELASRNHDLDDVNIHRVADDMDCRNSSKCIDFENRFRVSSSSSSDILASSSGSGGFLVKEDEGRPGCSVYDMDCPNSSKCIDFENRFRVSSSSSSDILASSSGSGGFLVEEDEGRPGCSVDGMDCRNSSIDFENRFHVSSSSSSDILASSSGSGGFVVEEDEGRDGCSMDGRRLSCKRKTLEGNVGQSSRSGSCFPRATEGGLGHADPPCYDASGNASISSESSSFYHTVQANPRLGLGLGGISADSSCPINMPGGPDNSQRSYRFRVNHSMQQDSVPNNSPSPEPGGARRSDSPTTHRSSRFVPMSPPLDFMSSIPSDSSVSQSQPVILPVPAPRRNVQAPRWNGALNLRPGSSSSSTVSGVRDAMLPEDLNSRNPSRNITENPMLIPPVVARNPAQTLTHRSASSGNVGVSTHIASNSRSGSASASASASNTEPGPSWGPHHHPSSQYSSRLSEYVRRSLLSTVGSEHAGQGSNSQLLSGPVSSQEGIPSSCGNQGHNRSHARSALWIERQGDGAVGMPYSLRALAAGEGRSRHVSELRNVLDMMRRGDGLRFEDVMILDHSMLFGMADAHDQHRDMRLDVDNMSYEELLALEERIGDVCTGLSEDIILNCMKQRTYIHTMSDEQIEAEPCCICQEEYSEGEGIGTLDCGHDFHSECIKQWLAHKNLCPICKTTALAT